jgi:hypothetical protein
MLIKTLGLVGVSCSLFIVLSWIFGHLVIGVSFGSAYAVTASLLWRYAIATTILILIGTITSYQLALANSNFELPLIGGVCVEVILLIIFHKSLEQVINIMVIVNTFILVILLAKNLPLSAIKNWLVRKSATTF